MIPLQDVDFRLKSGEAIFAQLTSIGNGGFTAAVTEPYLPSQIPVAKFYGRLPCPSGSDAAMAFREVVGAVSNYASRTPGNHIVAVNNPCNCEFVPAIVQQDVVGPDVEVLVNGTAWVKA